MPGYLLTGDSARLNRIYDYNNRTHYWCAGTGKGWITITDGDGRTCTGYVGIDDLGSVGAISITRTPTSLSTEIARSVIDAIPQAYPITITNPAKFNISIYCNFYCVGGFSTYELRVEGTDSCYFNVYGSRFSDTYYYSYELIDSVGTTLATGSLSNATAYWDTYHKIEYRVDGHNLKMYWDRILIYDGDSAATAPFSGLNKITGVTWTYGTAQITFWANVYDQVTVPEGGWTTIDSGFDFDDIVSVETEEELIEITGLTATVNTISDISAGSTIAGGDYFIISSTSKDYYVWYTVDSVGVDPAPTGLLFGEGVVVAILSTDSANAVAVKTATALEGVT